VCGKTRHFNASSNDALAEWLRRVPAKYMGFPRESSNLSGVVPFLPAIFTVTVVKMLFPPSPGRRS
jgi:hypothetical protein